MQILDRCLVEGTLFFFLVRDFPSERRSRSGPEETRESSVRKPSLICGHLETGLLPDELFFSFHFFPTPFLPFFWGGSILCLFYSKVVVLRRSPKVT